MTETGALGEGGTGLVAGAGAESFLHFLTITIVRSMMRARPMSPPMMPPTMAPTFTS